jgi:hypothetical protein
MTDCVHKPIPYKLNDNGVILAECADCGALLAIEYKLPKDMPPDIAARQISDYQALTAQNKQRS